MFDVTEFENKIKKNKWKELTESDWTYIFNKGLNSKDELRNSIDGNWFDIAKNSDSAAFLSELSVNLYFIKKYIDSNLQEANFDSNGELLLKFKNASAHLYQDYWLNPNYYNTLPKPTEKDLEFRERFNTQYGGKETLSRFILWKNYLTAGATITKYGNGNMWKENIPVVSESFTSINNLSLSKVRDDGLVAMKGFECYLKQKNENNQNVNSLNSNNESTESTQTTYKRRK